MTGMWKMCMRHLYKEENILWTNGNREKGCNKTCIKWEGKSKVERSEALILHFVHYMLLILSVPKCFRWKLKVWRIFHRLWLNLKCIENKKQTTEQLRRLTLKRAISRFWAIYWKKSSYLLVSPSLMCSTRASSRVLGSRLEEEVEVPRGLVTTLDTTVWATWEWFLSRCLGRNKNAINVV